MSSIGDTPFSLRTRGPLPGLFTNQQNGTEQPAPAPAPIAAPTPTQGQVAAPQPAQAQVPQSTSTVLSKKRRRTPEPVDAAEIEDTPSPFIKAEPEDNRHYTAYSIEDDEDDQYDPQKDYSALTKMSEATRKYDPAQPVLRRSKRFGAGDRILSSEAGKYFEPPTICFTEAYRNKQLVHILRCHNEIETTKPMACGRTCKTIEEGDKRLINHPPVICTHAECIVKKEKEHAAVFMPRKRARAATPAIAGPRHGSVAPSAGNALRRSTRINPHDEWVAKANQRIAEDPALATLVENLEGPGMMPKSKRHAGYAYKKELTEDAMADRLFEVTGGLSLDLDAKPKLKREMRKLHVDGTDKLRGMGAAFGLKRKLEDEAAEAAKFVGPFGANAESERPYSYANSYNRVPGKKAIRNEEAGIFSIPETRYDEMVEEENGVIIEQEDTRSHRLPRNLIDEGDEVDDDDNAVGYQMVEACQVCEVADDQLQACKTCHQHFHPVCGRLDEDAPGAVAEAEAGGIHWRYYCDGEGCDALLEGIRYKCFNIACRDKDYCLACYRDISKSHVLQMAMKGDDPASHSFVPVRRDYTKSLDASLNAAMNGFECASCAKKAWAQKLGQEMLGKKPLTVAEIQSRVKEQKQTEKKAFEKSGARETVEERIMEKKAAGGISKRPQSRRSGRLSGNGMMDSIRPSHKIKFGSKRTAHLETLVEDAEMKDS